MTKGYKDTGRRDKKLDGRDYKDMKIHLQGQDIRWEVYI
jgi:hypothetical protein